MSQPNPSADDYAFALEPKRIAKHLRTDKPLLNEIAGGKLQVARGARYAHVACGFFAYIYRIKTVQGMEYALRCPRLRFPQDSVARYQALAHFLQVTPDARAYLATADHFDDALFVSVQSQGGRFPVQVMEWVGGKTLLEVVADKVTQNDKAGLGALATAWERLIIDLKKHGVIHADLHPENVIVSAGNKLRLVDYDTLIVPGFTPGTTSAGGMVTYFHPSYAREQKPRPVTTYLDDFGAINILLSLRALAINPTWRDTSEYLLFHAADIESPWTSRRFIDLLHCSDSGIRTLADAFMNECCADTETGNLRVEQFVTLGTPAVLSWGNNPGASALPGQMNTAPIPVIPVATGVVSGATPTARRTYNFSSAGTDDLPTSKGNSVRRVVIDDYKPQ